MVNRRKTDNTRTNRKRTNHDLQNNTEILVKYTIKDYSPRLEYFDHLYYVEASEPSLQKKP